MGNLVAGLVTEEALRQLFNSTMTAAFPDKLTPGFDPVVNVSMHSEGRYAFVELQTPEMASAALQLSNQVQLLGQSISVGRPSGYVDPSKAQQAASAAAAALAAFKVSHVTQNVSLLHWNCADTLHVQKWAEHIVCCLGVMPQTSRYVSQTSNAILHCMSSACVLDSVRQLHHINQ